MSPFRGQVIDGEKVKISLSASGWLATFVGIFGPLALIGNTYLKFSLSDQRQDMRLDAIERRAENDSRDMRESLSEIKTRLSVFKP